MDKLNDKAVELLCIGHMCHDIRSSGHLLGGTASYASLMSAHLGVDTGLITSVGDDFKFMSRFDDKGVQVEKVAARQTTVFENVYKGDARTQHMHARASTIGAVDIPEAWLSVPTVKFCLIADEIDSEVVRSFSHSFRAATIQGWLRQWNDDGLISPKDLDMNLLDGMDMIFLSEDDISGDDLLLSQMRSKVETVVMTRGSLPAKIYRGKTELEFPVYPVQEVDPTGAGDIFAISFLIHYRRTESLVLSAAYAHSAASFVVEHIGVFLPPVQDIERRYTSYIEQFIS